ncbi:MAG: hypothetical protein E6860_07480 [Clostridium sp.]|uniref:hypothetical protein n=1 Tax=Clostridium sp. TaxID=1506 RepID=UPI0028FE823E|nr:hypothetical protein [Clostridium sp.]MDU1585376.1 hypothetical protein [Clostridium sp.]MDU1978478.1 hypothetical protein [Clostridium sp.]MDU1994724.1 hypothetical protein [Clostridium sp.]MDU6048383.1 hypothetical protein [Clostridium sp.]MDU6222441.1 hypothetical protein [Clostridium sp.]
MKLSNEILVNSVGVLSKLTNLELPIKLSYAFSKNITKIDAELKAYNIEREKLLNKYGEKDEEGKLKLSEKGEVNILDRENFNKEIAELLQCESEIDIHLIDLEKIDTEIKITPGELMIIDYMFK